MKLIINADDFGLCKSVNEGILKSFKDGVVTSTTMLANTDGFSDAVKIYNENQLNVGIHLTLTIGNPVDKSVKTIVDENGHFYNLSNFEKNLDSFSKDEIEREFLAQIEKIERQGIIISHIDTHHHIHKHKKISDVICNIALQKNIPLRNVSKDIDLKSLNIKTTDYFDETFYKDAVSLDSIIDLIEKYDVQKDITLEIMSHPSILGEDLYLISSYNDFRKKELDILCSPELKKYLKENNIEIISYRTLNG